MFNTTSFFNEKGTPILLIEIVATHDLDKSKIFKIESIGIDTLKVKIPKCSKEEIENTFLTTDNTEWVYNYERESTEYIRIPKRSVDTISSINEFQRRIVKSGESYECKKARINNLTRKINGCLESEQFRNTKETITKELQRVEENTERNRIRLRELQEEYKREVEKEFESETVRFENEERKFSNRFGELEERYLIKAEKLRDSHNNYESPDQGEIDRIEEEQRERGLYGLTIEERMDGIRREKEGIENCIKHTSNKIREEDDDFWRIEDEIREISRKIIRESEKYRENRERIESEFNRNREDLVQEFERSDFTRASSIGKRIKEIVDGGKLLSIIEQGTRDFIELRIAQKHLKSETCRDWAWS